MEDNENDLDVTESGGELSNVGEKAKSTLQTGKRTTSDVNKLLKKGMEKAKNGKMKKTFELLGKIGSKLGPAIPYILIAILIIIVVVGLLAFLVSMPGMITGKLKELAQKVSDWFESLVVGRAEALVNEEDIIETANYIKSMGYDLIGYGFIPADKSFATGTLDISELNSQGYTDSDGDGIYKNSSGETYSGTYIGDDGYIYQGETGKKTEYEKKAGSYPDQYGIIYGTTGEETGVPGTFESAGSIVDFSDNTDTSLIRTYLMSDMKAYIIRNFDNSDVTKKIIETLFNVIIAMGGGSPTFEFEYNKWAYGLMSIYNATEGIATDKYGMTEQGNIKIDVNNKTMAIKGGWGSNPITYSIDGWTGRYGLSLEFLLSLHLATMSPELVDTITRTFNTDIQVYLDEIKKVDEDGESTITAYFKTDDGQEITLKNIQEASGDDGVISPQDAYKIMKDYGIKSKNYDPFKCEIALEATTLFLNDSTSDKSYNEIISDSDNYNQNVIEGKGNGGSEEYEDIASLNTWTDVQNSSSSPSHINKTKLEEVGEYINSAISHVDANYISEGYTTTDTYTYTDIASLENIITFADFKGEVESIRAKKCEIRRYKHSDKDNNGDIVIELLVYRTSADHNWDIGVVVSKELSENEKSGASNKVCSDCFDDEGFTSVCSKCEKYVENIRDALKDTKDDSFKGKVPYIARVIDSWFRDTYFVIPTDEAAKKDKAIEMAYSTSDTDNNYKHGELYGTGEKLIKLSGNDIEIVQVDNEYLEETEEYWSKYIMNEDGTYRLYLLNNQGGYAQNLDEITPALSTEVKGKCAKDADGYYYYNGNSEDAEKDEIRVVKKPKTLKASEVETSDDGEEGEENVTPDHLVWSSYRYGTTASDEKIPLEVDSSTGSEPIKNVCINEYGDYEDKIYYSLKNSRTIAQVEDGQRGITNSRIKKMFKVRKYYMYDGTSEKAEAIYDDWKKVIANNGGNEEVVEKYLDDYYYYDEKKLKDDNGEIVGDPRNPDLIANIDINTDSLNAFSILENIHTLDAEYAYRDFKELIVELNYFDKEDLSDKIPEVFTWIIPELNSTWPIRYIDKSEEYYGTYIHSDEAIKSIKENLGITEDEDGEVEADPEAELSEKDAQILNDAKGYIYKGESETEEDTETETEAEAESDSEEETETETEAESDSEESEESTSSTGEVIAPVTGEIVGYGTYERTNTDLVKYEGLSEEDAKEEVGYIQIQVMNSENYFKEIWFSGEQKNTEVPKDPNKPNGEKYSSVEALNAFYEEYKGVCDGYIVTIDGIETLGGVTTLEGLRGLPDSSFEVTDKFKPNTAVNLVDDKKEKQNQQKENAKAETPAVVRNGKRIYVREGTIIGYTTKNETKKGYEKDYSYIRVMLRNEQKALRENVENYFDLPERVTTSTAQLTSLDFLSDTSTKEEKIKAAISYFISEGFSEEGAAGIVGNIFQESKLDPGADNGSHFGICQWNYGGPSTNPTSGRWKKVLSWMTSNGYNYDSFSGQLMGIIKSEDANSYTGYFEQMKKATTVFEAADIWCRHYEICGNYGEEVPKRTEFGEDALKLYRGEITEFPHN